MTKQRRRKVADLHQRNDDDMRRIEAEISEDTTDLRVVATHLQIPPLRLARFIHQSQALRSFELRGCFKGDIATCLFHAVSQQKKIKEMAWGSVVKAGAEALANAIATCPLIKLDLFLCDGFSDDGNDSFFNAGVRNTTLEEIRIQNYSRSVTSRADRTIASFFQHPGFLASLRALQVTVNGGKTAAALGSLLQAPSCKVRSLAMSMNREEFYSRVVGERSLLALELLFSGLKRNQSITNLRLEHLRLVPEVAGMLRDTLGHPKCRLEVLKFESVCCDEASGWETLVDGIILISSPLVETDFIRCGGLTEQSLTRLLKKHQTLRSLMVEYSDSTGLSPVLSTHVAMHPTLEKFGFHRHSSSTEENVNHIHNLIYTVSTNHKLQELSIALHEEDKETAGILADFLESQDSSGLKRLELCSEGMRDSVLCIVLQALKNNKGLVSLALESCLLDYAACHVLVDCLPKMRHLKELCFPDIAWFETDMFPEVIKSLKQNQSLIRLDTCEMMDDPKWKSTIDQHLTSNKFRGLLEKYHQNFIPTESTALLPTIIESLLDHNEGESVCFQTLQTSFSKMIQQSTKVSKSLSCQAAATSDPANQPPY